MQAGPIIHVQQVLPAWATDCAHDSCYFEDTGQELPETLTGDFAAFLLLARHDYPIEI